MIPQVTQNAILQKHVSLFRFLIIVLKLIIYFVSYHLLENKININSLSNEI